MYTSTIKTASTHSLRMIPASSISFPSVFFLLLLSTLVQRSAHIGTRTSSTAHMGGVPYTLLVDSTLPRAATSTCGVWASLLSFLPAPLFVFHQLRLSTQTHRLQKMRNGRRSLFFALVASLDGWTMAFEQRSS